jgi:hypothetical protein
VEKSGVISAYMERIARALDFDPALSRCVQREIEDHLYQAAAADPAGDRLEAERRAVAKFGDPGVIASQFAVVSLARRTRHVGVAAVLVIAAVFVAMKTRLMSYALMPWPGGEQTGALGAIVGSIDRYAFWVSVFVGIAAWLYIDSRSIPAAFTREYRAQLWRFLLLCSTATGALTASVVCDGVLTSLRIIGTARSAEFLIPPVLTMAIEIACVGRLVASICGIVRRKAYTAHLPPLS